jgi:hypothetical protein
MYSQDNFRPLGYVTLPVAFASQICPPHPLRVVAVVVVVVVVVVTAQKKVEGMTLRFFQWQNVCSKFRENW